MTTRVRRALLFCPGTERRKIDKASGMGADGVIIDLEDAAALNKKAEAREITAKALTELDFGRSERLVRINTVESGLALDDLVVVGAPESLPDTFVLPKVQSSDDLRFVSHHIDVIEAGAGRAPGTVRLIAIVESARGLLNLKGIAGASDRLDAIIFGAEDYCGDTGAVRTAEGLEVLYAQSAVVAHAAAFELQAIDTPFVDLTDLDACERAAWESLHLGFTGKLAIHPKQIAPINAVFTPSPQQVADAERLIAAHDANQAAGIGVFELDGKMVDQPMVRAAERVLARAAASEA